MKIHFSLLTTGAQSREAYRLYSLTPRSIFRILPSAAALTRVPQDYGLQERIASPEDPITPTTTGPNVFFVTPEMGSALLGTTVAGLAAYQEAVKAAAKPVASSF